MKQKLVIFITASYETDEWRPNGINNVRYGSNTYMYCVFGGYRVQIPPTYSRHSLLYGHFSLSRARASLSVSGELSLSPPFHGKINFTTELLKRNKARIK